jgi:SynChlorMet cassette radical SAM/SPASM protein ScmE
MHCSYANEMNSLPDLPTQSWLAFFEELEACKVMIVALTGGEPFIRDDLCQIIDGIIKHKMRFSITTNATLISEEITHYLKGCRRLDNIQVSIEGSQAEIHERLRGQDSFEPALKGLNLLIGAGLPVAVRVTATPCNLDDLNNICYMLINMGVEKININECYPFGRGLNNYDSLKLTPEQYVQAIKILMDFNETHPGILCGQSGPFVAYSRLKDAEKSIANGKTIRGKVGYLSGCNCAFRAISVLHDGQYVPCHQLSQLGLGQINTDHLAEIWQNSPLLQMLRGRRRVSLEETEEACRGCRHQPVCTGGCPAQVYAVTGELNRPDLASCYAALEQRGFANVV